MDSSEASFSHQLEYWLSMLYPSQSRWPAEEMDSLCHQLLEKVCGSHLPETPGRLSCSCCSTVEGLGLAIPGMPVNTPFQSLTIGLTNKQGGMGLRFQEFLIPYAFYGGCSRRCRTLERGCAHHWLTSTTKTGV